MGVSSFRTIFLALTIASFSVIGTQSIKFNFKNNCQYTVWPGALTSNDSPAQLGNTGFELAAGATSSVDSPAGWKGRFWGRTSCNSDSGRLTCAVGDCGSGQVGCNGNGGAPPVSLAEFTLNGDGNKDFYDISLVDGSNVPLSIAPTGSGCPSRTCSADINQGCPNDLAVRGSDNNIIACKSGCLAKGTEEYCCTGSHNTAATCPATDLSKIFKDKCPEAYTYAYDDKSALVSCPSGGDYTITFCP